MPGNAGEAAAKAFRAREHPWLVAALTYRVGDRAIAEELDRRRSCGPARGGAASVSWTRRVGGRGTSRGTWPPATASHLRRRQAERRAYTRHGPPREGHVDPEPGDPRVAAALGQLPDRQRDAVVLRHVLDLSVEETAARLGVSPDAVRSLIKRGVAALRTDLGPTDHADAAATSEHHDR